MPDNSPGDDRRLRHDLRGAFDELRLCVEVLRVESDPAEVLKWLELIDGAAGRCASLAGQLGELGPEATA